MATDERPAGCPDHIDAVNWNGEAVWPENEPFPLTAEECLWAMKGYAILPASGPINSGLWHRMAYRRWELLSGRIAPS